MMAKMLPKQPHLRSPSGSLSESRQTTNPTNGVNRTDKKKVQPKPIFLLAPNSPTKAAKNESLNNPKINSDIPIVLRFIVILPYALVPYSNKVISPVGLIRVFPKCLYAKSVHSRPRGVRMMKPS